MLTGIGSNVLKPIDGGGLARGNIVGIFMRSLVPLTALISANSVSAALLKLDFNGTYDVRYANPFAPETFQYHSVPVTGSFTYDQITPPTSNDGVTAIYQNAIQSFSFTSPEFQQYYGTDTISSLSHPGFGSQISMQGGPSYYGMATFNIFQDVNQRLSISAVYPIGYFAGTQLPGIGVSSVGTIGAGTYYGFNCGQASPCGPAGEGTITSFNISEATPPVDATAPSTAQLVSMAVSAYDNTAVTGFAMISGNRGSIGTRAPGDNFAQAFISEAEHGGRDQIVVAIRGSTDKADFFEENGSFASGKATAVFTDDALEIAELFKKLSDDHPGADFTVTGHSLGGALAQAVGEVLHVDAVGFDAPGAKNVLSVDSRSEIYDIATGNNLTSIYSSTDTLSSYRVYGDVISLAGTSFDNVFTITPNSAEAAQHIEKAKLLPSSCASYCHSKYLIQTEILNNNTGEPGYSDDHPYQKIVYGYEKYRIAEFGLFKKFKQSFISESFLIFDPILNGNFIVIDLDDDSDLINQLLLPAFSNFDVYFQNQGDWESIGTFSGFSAISLPASKSYAISNASELADEDGNFFVMLRGDIGTSFSGSIYSTNAINAPEPSTWMQLILGFTLCGCGMRIKRKKSLIT